MGNFTVEEFGYPKNDISNLEKQINNITANNVVDYIPAIFTATLDNTTIVSHNLNYIPVTDVLEVYYLGCLLEEGINYFFPNTSSIDLEDWSIDIDEQIMFRLWKNVKK